MSTYSTVSDYSEYDWKTQQSLRVKDKELKLKDRELEKNAQELKLKDRELEKNAQELELKDRELEKRSRAGKECSGARPHGVILPEYPA